VRGVFRTDHTAWEIGTVTEHRVWPDAGRAHSRSPRRWPSCFGWMNWPASRGPFLPGPPAGCPPWRMLLRSHWGSSLSPDQPTTHFAAGKTQTALVVVMEPSVAWMIACVNMLMYKIISFCSVVVSCYSQAVYRGRFGDWWGFELVVANRRCEFGKSWKSGVLLRRV
jgi:hypothetical protein